MWSVSIHLKKRSLIVFNVWLLDTAYFDFGFEIWGLSDNQESIERVHLSALKRFLGINSKSPRHLIYSETGRHPLFVNTYATCIKFWLRPRKTYNNYVIESSKTQHGLEKFEMFYTNLGLVWLENARCL